MFNVILTGFLNKMKHIAKVNLIEGENYSNWLFCNGTPTALDIDFKQSQRSIFILLCQNGEALEEC